jgi:dTDP-4-dehydrorhamnose reductase
MRLLVTGANGQVGWELSRSLNALGDVVALDRQQCDLSQPQRLPDLIRDVKPDVIVNAAGYTAVDQAEREEQLATTVNGTAVGVIADEARRAGALLVHYSTDYVFDGAKATPYTEDDAPRPINAYGRSKLVGENAIRDIAGAHVILRTSWLYAARGHNFVHTVLRLARQREELRIVTDQVGAPTWARDVAGATARLVAAAGRERTAGHFPPGIFNLTASGATSWHGFAEAILREARQNGLIGAQHQPRLHPIRSEDYPAPAARPKNSRLDCDRIRSRFGIALPDWKQSLALCLTEMQACDP